MTIMTWHRRNDPNPYVRIIALSLFLAVIALASWQRDVVVSVAGPPFAALAGPIWSGSAQLTGSSAAVGTFFSSKAALSEENAQLRHELMVREVEALRYEVVMREHALFKEMGGRAPEELSYVLATVLSKPNHTPYDTLIIDAGSNQGVARGDMVTAYGDIIIGEIENVSTRTAKVQLFSSPGTSVNVTLAESGVVVAARGLGGGNFLAEVPREVRVDEGGLVIFPLLNTQIVGVVERMQVRPSDAFRTIYFSLPVNINDITWVQVISRGVVTFP